MIGIACNLSYIFCTIRSSFNDGFLSCFQYYVLFLCCSIFHFHNNLTLYFSFLYFYFGNQLTILIYHNGNPESRSSDCHSRTWSFHFITGIITEFIFNTVYHRSFFQNNFSFAVFQISFCHNGNHSIWFQ